MSNRSRVIREQKALQFSPIVKSFPNVQPRPPAAQQMQVGLGQLAEILMSQGAARGYKIQFSEEAKIVRVVADCGELSIPLDFTPDEARKMADSIRHAADNIDPPADAAPEEPVITNPEAEALLREFMLNRASQDARARSDELPRDYQ